MAKRGQYSTKKGKSASGKKSKSPKGKKRSPKRGVKNQRTKTSKTSTSSSSSSSSKRQGHQKGRKQKGKAPSNFNLYMKTSVEKIKHDHPSITHQDAFKKAAEQWAVSSDNPKNKHN